MNAVLALENGSWYRGIAVGASGTAKGEVVFNTSMTGYQEVLTDPSYTGQIVTMTCPEIGNYGISVDDSESKVPRVAGFIMRESSPIASSWRADSTLRDYMIRHGIVAIADIDTRALTRLLRTAGVMRGVIGTGDVEPDYLVEEARKIPKVEGTDLVSGVTCSEPFDWSSDNLGIGEPGLDSREFSLKPMKLATRPLRVAAYDFGIKWNILRRLVAHGCKVRVFPAKTSPNELLETKPDGVLLSNGPGDPAPLEYAISNTRDLITADVPMFGICLGHQILALALGGRTFKLKFGHRGSNHPVKQLATGKVEITTQNHGFAVDPSSLSGDAEVTHLNLNDSTVEGIRHRVAPIFSVQYHPEASPGPHDADYLFLQFLNEMEKRTGGG